MTFIEYIEAMEGFAERMETAIYLLEDQQTQYYPDSNAER